MAHATRNFKTKTELKKAVASEEGAYVQESMFGSFVGYGRDQNTVEGPWEYHKWYAAVTVDPETGRILKVK